MVSWVMLTLSSREHIPPLSSFALRPMSAPNTAHQVSGRKMSQKMYAPTNSRIKDVRFPSHPPDRPTQTSPKSILSWVERRLRQKSCWKKLQPEATNLAHIERRT